MAATNTTVKVRCPDCGAAEIRRVASVDATWPLESVEMDEKGRLSPFYDVAEPDWECVDTENELWYCRFCAFESADLDEFVERKSLA